MKFPTSFYNPLSLFGAILASVNFFIILFFLVAMSLFNFGGSYLGLFTYIVLPVFLIIGLILIPIGMVRRTRKLLLVAKGGPVKGIKLDLNDKKHWNAIAIFVFVTFLFLFLTGIGSYEAFHYTESNEFCGLLCHKVMEPEYVAYEGSSHSRVDCVECHVGTGANWYVKSKLSGLYQVYSVLTKKYPTPIPTPVKNLRPARETCEKCHWPGKFYSYRLRNEKHFLADSINTEWNIQLKMKIGPEHSAMGLSSGIHWHINQDVKIEYISSTEDREYLPWVRYVDLATGDTIIYNDIYESLDKAAVDTMEVRTMDCIDCHNRPSHHYLPPQEFTDMLMASGDIPADLPGVKTLAMEVLNSPFDNRDTARLWITNRTYKYYEENFPDVISGNKDKVDKALEAILKGYARNIFPEMGASWDVYPNHIGHVEFNGCFRCHNGNHEADNGDIITRDCDACHTILAQGTSTSFESVEINSSLQFRHPTDIGEAWKEYACTECHRYLY